MSKWHLGLVVIAMACATTVPAGGGLAERAALVVTSEADADTDADTDADSDADTDADSDADTDTDMDDDSSSGDDDSSSEDDDSSSDGDNSGPGGGDDDDSSSEDDDNSGPGGGDDDETDEACAGLAVGDPCVDEDGEAGTCQPHDSDPTALECDD